MKTPGERKRELERKSWEADLLTRLQTAAGGRKFRVLAEMTECHPETVRRYLRKGKPSAYFVARVCKVLAISPEWLLMGTGSMGTTDRALEPKPRKRQEEAAGASRGGSTVVQDPAPTG